MASAICHRCNFDLICVAECIAEAQECQTHAPRHALLDKPAMAAYIYSAWNPSRACRHRAEANGASPMC